MRRVIRPGGRLMRIAAVRRDASRRATCSTRVNAGEVSAAPPKAVPPGVPRSTRSPRAARPAGRRRWAARRCSRGYPLAAAGCCSSLGVVVAGRAAACSLVPAIGRRLVVARRCWPRCCALAAARRRAARAAGAAHRRGRPDAGAVDEPAGQPRLRRSPMPGRRVRRRRPARPTARPPAGSRPRCATRTRCSTPARPSARRRRRRRSTSARADRHGRRRRRPARHDPAPRFSPHRAPALDRATARPTTSAR